METVNWSISNQCLGARIGAGAKHIQCRGYYAPESLGTQRPCRCDCHPPMTRFTPLNAVAR